MGLPNARCNRWIQSTQSTIAEVEGETELNYDGPEAPYEHLDVENSYSWLKSPRWKGNVMEVGPLARVLLLTFGFPTLVFRSVVVAGTAVALNLLSVGAAYGVIVAVFQWGWGKDLVGLSETVPIVSWVPMFLFAILFGLSMDYEVFLLSRIKEEHDRTGRNAASVALGLERTGRIVSAAAALLAITFLAFGTADVTFLKLFGIGLALAVVMDATVIRGLLVPAVMRLAGPANWWTPAPLRRFHRRFGIGELPEPVVAAEPTRPLVGAGNVGT